MGSLVKKLITEITFRDNLSSRDEARYLKLRYESEGDGRYFTLVDENEASDVRPKTELYFDTPDDFKLLWETAQALWEQGDIYYDEGPDDPELKVEEVAE